MDRVYFDYNIYTSLANSVIHMPMNYTQYARIYISVAHAEEFVNARENNFSNENKDHLDRIKALLTGELNNYGVLKPQLVYNPQKSVKIINAPEGIDRAIHTIEQFDTRDSIKRDATKMHKRMKRCFKRLQEKDKGIINNSNLSPEEIWNRSEINSCIKFVNNRLRRTDYGNPSMIPSLIENYAIADLILLYEFKKLKPYVIKKRMYSSSTPNFSELEKVVEILQCVLTACGYNGDKSERTANSGAYDTEHAIYATYCTYFVSGDERLRKRLNAIYYFLGLSTKAISFDEWRKIIESQISEEKTDE